MRAKILSVLALSLLALSPAAAEPGAALTEWPEAFRGAWYSGKSCDAVEALVFRADDFSVSGTLRPIRSGPDAGKYRGYYTPLANARALAHGRLTHETETRDPVSHAPARRTTQEEVTDDQLIVLSLDQPDQRTVWRRCPEPAFAGRRPEVLGAFWDDVTDLAAAKMRLVQQCAIGPAECAGAAIAAADVNRDGKLSRAEVSRMIRRAVKFTFLSGPASPLGGDAPEAFDLGAVLAAEIGTGAVAPLATMLLFNNLDYAGAGFITAADLELTLAGGRTSLPDMQALTPMLKGEVGRRLEMLKGIGDVLAH